MTGLTQVYRPIFLSARSMARLCVGIACRATNFCLRRDTPLREGHFPPQGAFLARFSPLAVSLLFCRKKGPATGGQRPSRESSLVPEKELGLERPVTSMAPVERPVESHGSDRGTTGSLSLIGLDGVERFQRRWRDRGWRQLADGRVRLSSASSSLHLTPRSTVRGSGPRKSRRATPPRDDPSGACRGSCPSELDLHGSEGGRSPARSAVRSPPRSRRRPVMD